MQVYPVHRANGICTGQPYILTLRDSPVTDDPVTGLFLFYVWTSFVRLYIYAQHPLVETHLWNGYFFSFFRYSLCSSLTLKLSLAFWIVLLCTQGDSTPSSMYFTAWLYCFARAVAKYHAIIILT